MKDLFRAKKSGPGRRGGQAQAKAGAGEMVFTYAPAPGASFVKQKPAAPPLPPSDGKSKTKAMNKSKNKNKSKSGSMRKKSKRHDPTPLPDVVAETPPLPLPRRVQREAARVTEALWRDTKLQLEFTAATKRRGGVKFDEFSPTHAEKGSTTTRL